MNNASRSIKRLGASYDMRLLLLVSHITSVCSVFSFSKSLVYINIYHTTLNTRAKDGVSNSVFTIVFPPDVLTLLITIFHCKLSISTYFEVDTLAVQMQARFETE